MEIGIKTADFLPNEVLIDPTIAGGGKLLEVTDPVTNKRLREMTFRQLGQFNKDLMAIAAQFAAEPIRQAVAKYQREALVMARVVMDSSRQPYGGAYGMADEIVMRLIRPVDLASTIEEYWDLDCSAETVGDVWGLQTGGTTPADDTLGEEEGNIIFGFLDQTPGQPAFAAYQFVKGGKTWPYYTLDFSICRADSIPFVEAMAPLMEFPEELVRLNLVVARAVNPARMSAVGLHFCRASAIRTVTGSA